MNLSIFTVFLKNRKFTSKIKRSKVTDFAALKGFSGKIRPYLSCESNVHDSREVRLLNLFFFSNCEIFYFVYFSRIIISKEQYN